MNLISLLPDTIDILLQTENGQAVATVPGWTGDPIFVDKRIMPTEISEPESVLLHQNRFNITGEVPEPEVNTFYIVPTNLAEAYPDREDFLVSHPGGANGTRILIQNTPQILQSESGFSSVSGLTNVRPADSF